MCFCVKGLEERLFVTEVDLVREENVKEKKSHVSK